MKDTLANVKQLFNVKSIAYNTNMNTLADGQFGIFPNDSDVSIPSGTTLATMPEKFRIISKLDGKHYFSFDAIEKARISNTMAKPYVAEKVNIWKGIVKDCTCMGGAILSINISEQSLIQRDGLTWTHKDFIVDISPKELDCYCNCDGSKPVYENNVLTMLLHEKITAMNSPFYESKVELEDGTPITDVRTFVETNKAINTDANTTNDGAMLVLVIQGKPSKQENYRDLEINYVYPRGVRIQPSVQIIGTDKSIGFTEFQPLQFEIGAGYDIRAEEFDNMSYYTNMSYPQLNCGIADPRLVYQFENKKNYNTLTFEFESKKTGLGVRGESHKDFGVMLATDDTAVFTELVSMFI